VIFSPDTKMNKEAVQISFDSINPTEEDLGEFLDASGTANKRLLADAVRRVKEGRRFYTIEQVLEALMESTSEAKWVLVNKLEMYKDMGLFSQTPTRLSDMVKEGQTTIIDLKGSDGDLQEVLVNRIIRKLFEARKLGKVPPMMLVAEEARLVNVATRKNKVKLVGTRTYRGGKVRGITVTRWRKLKEDEQVDSERPALGVVILTDKASREIKRLGIPAKIRINRVDSWNAEVPQRESSYFILPAPGEYPASRAYLLGLLSARLGFDQLALGYARGLEQVAATETGSLHGDLALGVRAEVARLAGNTLEALGYLERTRGHVSSFQAYASPFAGQARERFLRAELLRALGRDVEAIRWYESIGDGAAYDFAYLAPAQLGLGQVHEARSDTTAAVRHYRRFLELWGESDEEFRAMVDTARTRLGQLTDSVQ